jgi:divalent metal cation (Fe/Co/Zn/Cd) transporter
MSDDRQTWIRHSFYLALFTAFFHSLQFTASLALWMRTKSPAIISFGLDAFVSVVAALVLASRIRIPGQTSPTSPTSPTGNFLSGYGYMAASAVAFYQGASMLWSRERPIPSVLNIVVAAVSMLVIPIIGSYMKVLAVELRSRTLKSAAIFTFGNSYLSMVLLIASLLNYGMNLGWGDPLGALVMFPFMAQKGIQILLEEGKHEYVED